MLVRFAEVIKDKAYYDNSGGGIRQNERKHEIFVLPFLLSLTVRPIISVSPLSFFCLIIFFKKRRNLLLIALFFRQFRHIEVVNNVFKGLRPAVVALIVAPIIGLTKGMHWVGLSIALATAVTVWYFGFSPIWLIIAGAIGGVLWVAYKGKEVNP